MKGKGIYILGCVLILLAGIYFYERRQEEGRAKALEEEKRVFRIQEKDPHLIELLVQQGEPIRLEKEKAWEVVLPVRAHTDEIEVERFLGLLKRLGYSKVIKESTEELQEFGLDKPMMRISVGSGDSKETLFIGAPTPVGFGYYAMIEGGKKVFTLEDRDVKDLKKDLFYFRDKRLLNLNPQEVMELHVKGRGFECLLRREGEAWSGLEGISSAKVETLLGRFIWSQAKAVASEDKTGLQRFGLEDPVFSLTIKTKEGSQGVFVGNSVEGEGGVYATSDYTPHIFVMPAWLSTYIPKGISDLQGPES